MSVLSTEIDRMLTPREVAEVLGVARPYVYGLVNTGTLPSRKIGSMRRVWLSDLKEWVASQ